MLEREIFPKKPEISASLTWPNIHILCTLCMHMHKRRNN